jgi:hypothetical protein
LTGGHYSEVDLVLKLLRRDLEWSLLTGGRYSEVVVSTGLTVFGIGIVAINFLTPSPETVTSFMENSFNQNSKFCSLESFLHQSFGVVVTNFLTKDSDVIYV